MKSYYRFILTVLFSIFTFTASSAQILWTKYDDPITTDPAFAESDPVLNPGPSGSWDVGFVGTPSVLFDGEIYHMWYGNFANGKHERIGYATSTDGLNWTKYDDSTTTSPQFAESDPVLIPGEAGAWDDEDVATPTVILIDTTYHMWYAGGYYSILSIGHATSTDGINWERDPNNPVLVPGTNGSWDDVWIYAPCVLFKDNIYHMWYEGYNGTGNQVRIGHATSPHPDSSWTKDPSNPVLRFGVAGSWDSPRVDSPRVIFDGNTYHMWYSGGGWYVWNIGYATSQDGNIWTKYDDPTTTSIQFAESDPVLVKGPSGTWDDYNAGFCFVLFDTTESNFKMWYSGGNGVGNGQVGYATALVTALEEVDCRQYPAEFTLRQNYPNPFNPTTTIEFSIPKSEFVTVKIYNLLGQEVADTGFG